MRASSAQREPNWTGDLSGVSCPPSTCARPNRRSQPVRASPLGFSAGMDIRTPSRLGLNRAACPIHGLGNIFHRLRSLASPGHVYNSYGEQVPTSMLSVLHVLCSALSTCISLRSRSGVTRAQDPLVWASIPLLQNSERIGWISTDKLAHSLVIFLKPSIVCQLVIGDVCNNRANLRPRSGIRFTC